MKTISNYTICCSAEQTRKALELGAPIKNYIIYEESRKLICIAKSDNNIEEYEKELNKYHQTIIGDMIYCLPTAEQMIGWLRSEGIKFLLSDEPDSEGCYWFIGNSEEPIACGQEKENKELAAIDAALEYLTNRQ